MRGSDRWFAGVCGGIARRAGLNPFLVRIIAIVLAILGGPVLFVYAVGWALLPDAQGRIHAEQALRGIFEPVMIAIVAVLALTAGAVTAGLWSNGVWSSQALLVGLAAALGVLALGIVISGIRGREGGAMGGLAVLAAAALVLLGVFPTGTAFFPVGAPVWTVSPVAAGAPPGYVVLAGKSTVDLSRFDEPAGSDGRTIDIWMGMGVTELILPTDRAVQVEAGAFIGGINYSGDPSSQGLGGLFFHDQRVFNDGGTRVMPRIRVWTFLGQVTIAGDNSSIVTNRPTTQEHR